MAEVSEIQHKLYKEEIPLKGPEFQRGTSRMFLGSIKCMYQKTPQNGTWKLGVGIFKNKTIIFLV